MAAAAPSPLRTAINAEIAKIDERYAKKLNSKADKQNYRKSRVEAGYPYRVRVVSGGVVSDELEMNEMRSGNEMRNRSDFVPYDYNRVQISSGYINATLAEDIDQVKGKSFILAQGPQDANAGAGLVSTVDHFWTMIYEKNVGVVAMVTRFSETDESGNVKVMCSQYIPLQLNAVLHFGNFDVTLIQETDGGYFVERKLKVQKTGSSDPAHEVHHFQYVAWPDAGVPQSHSQVLDYVVELRKALVSAAGSGPLLIHCSQGVGRTGCIAVVTSSLAKIEQDPAAPFDFFKYVLMWRRYRYGLIADTQLKFTLECIDAAWDHPFWHNKLG